MLDRRGNSGKKYIYSLGWIFGIILMLLAGVQPASGALSISPNGSLTPAIGTNFLISFSAAGYVGFCNWAWTGSFPPNTQFNSNGSDCTLQIWSPTGFADYTKYSFTLTVTDSQSSASQQYTVQARPFVGNLNWGAATVGAPALTITMTGRGFLQGATVTWDGSPLTTTFINDTTLQATIPASLFNAPRIVNVSMTNPDGLSANSVPFYLLSPATPTITSLSQTTISEVQAQTVITINGTGFAPTSVVTYLDSVGSSALYGQSYVSPSQMTMQVGSLYGVRPGAVKITVTNGNLVSNVVTLTVTPAVITINSLSPNSVPAGSAYSLNLLVNVTGAPLDSLVRWNGIPMPGTWISPIQYSATVGSIQLATPGTASITVGEYTLSPPSTFQITASSLPQITVLDPTFATASVNGFSFKVKGTSFTTDSKISFGGTVLGTEFDSSNQLVGFVPSNLNKIPGTVPVTVSGTGGTSNPVSFTIVPAPLISNLDPSSVQAGNPAFTLLLNGSGFANGDSVFWNASQLPTVFISTNQLSASVPANLIAKADTVNIVISRGSYISEPTIFTITQPKLPAITGLNPAFVQANGLSFTMTVTGTNFSASSIVTWDGIALSTVFVSTTQLSTTVPANLIANTGTAAIAVSDSGKISNSVNFTITTNTPTIILLDPASAIMGGTAFQLAVVGTNYTSSSVVYWNNTALITTLVSNSQLSATVPANLIATAGSATITVKNPQATSSGATFTITSPSAPAITSLSQTSASAGGAAFQLTVNGVNYTNTSVVYWNTSPLATSFVSSTQLAATVPASLIAAAGSVNITVKSGSSSSNAMTFNITKASDSTGCGSSTTSVIPQIADGGGWQTTIVLVNTTSSTSPACLNFFADTGNGATIQWNVTVANGTSYQTLQIAPHSTVFLQTQGTAASLTAGWAQVSSSAGVQAFAIFKDQVPGRQDQEGTAPATAATQDTLVPFDNTDGNVTSIALVNPGGAAATYTAALRATSGVTSQQSIIVPAGGHIAFVLTDQFASAAGLQGVVEFSGAAASVIALRFNSTGAFTSVPVFNATGVGSPGTACPATGSGQIIPQIADGGGWQTTLVLVNTNTTSANACLNFQADSGNGTTGSWIMTMLNNARYQNISIPATSAVFLQTPGGSPVLTTGWAQMLAAQGIQAFAIFKEQVPGRQDQEGTAIASAAGLNIFVPFDNMNGNTTSLGMVNPGGGSQLYSATLNTTSSSTSLSPVTLSGSGHIAFAMVDQFPQAASQQGVVQFQSTGNSLSILGLRFNSTGAFTSLPVFPIQ